MAKEEEAEVRILAEVAEAAARHPEVEVEAAAGELRILAGEVEVEEAALQITGQEVGVAEEAMSTVQRSESELEEAEAVEVEAEEETAAAAEDLKTAGKTTGPGEGELGETQRKPGRATKEKSRTGYRSTTISLRISSRGTSDAVS